jgi:hypothetical protein
MLQNIFFVVIFFHIFVNEFLSGPKGLRSHAEKYSRGSFYNGKL